MTYLPIKTTNLVACPKLTRSSQVWPVEWCGEHISESGVKMPMCYAYGRIVRDGGVLYMECNDDKYLPKV